MGTTVSSMFGHGPAHAQSPGLPGGAPLLALALLAAAALVVLVLRRRRGGGEEGGGGSNAGWRGALTALGGRATAGGPSLRVLSRLALGPGRYLCTVEAGDRVILVAVGGEVRMLGEVAASLPRRRSRRGAMARQLLTEREVSLDESRAAVVDLSGRAAASAPAASEDSATVPGSVAEEAATPAQDGPTAREGPPAARTAALLERYRAAAAGPAAAPAGPEGVDDEAAAYFSDLLEASLARMEAAERRLLRHAGRAGARRRTSPDAGSDDLWPTEDAGL
jgi:hypothetical protein